MSVDCASSSSFAQKLLAWHAHCGRHDLPWQKTRSPYHTWLSEVMLQQTQVATVIPYFEKFIQRFPDINVLARASEDELMKYWAGLGYYSRARNLHKTAIIIAEQYHGVFPDSFDQVIELPGIGRSTAGAILAQSFGQRHAILDGNVKRVLSRYHAVEGWYGKREVEQTLWAYAEQHTPDEQLADYSQAIMDLGATLCKRSSANCEACPLKMECEAYKQHRVDELPHRKPKKTLPVKEKRFLFIRYENEILLEKRPPTGIWGGLWSLPELDLKDDAEVYLQDTLALKLSGMTENRVYRHTFSHYHLDIHPLLLDVEPLETQIKSSENRRWVKDIADIGLPTPVKKLLQRDIQHFKEIPDLFDQISDQ